MANKILAVGIGAGLLLAACVIARRPGTEAEPAGSQVARAAERRGESAAEIDLTRLPQEGREAEVSPAPAVRETQDVDEPAGRSEEDSFWDDVAALLATKASGDPAKQREAVVARTAEYLGLEGTSRTAFEATVSSVAEEIGQAWAVRESLILTLPIEREQEEQAIQDRYEEVKRQALGRLEQALGAAAGRQEFRVRLEEWIDAVR